MKLGIDIDGVLAWFNKSFAELVGVPPIDFNEEHLTEWDWPQNVYHIPQPVIDEAWAVVKSSKHFWHQLSAYPTAKADLQALTEAVKRGHEIYFITQRPGSTAKVQTERWLMQQGFISIPTVLVVQDSADKKPLAAGLRLLALVDDKPSTLEAMPKTVTRFLFDRPWNRTHEGDIFRVTSIRQMLETLGIETETAHAQ